MSETTLGAHRGMGCTDHAFYIFRDIENLPVENTLQSVEAAFKAGVSYVEIDAGRSADRVLFVLHNVVPDDHFFGPNKPQAKLNLLPFADIASHNTGRFEKGKVARLDDMLSTIKHHAPSNSAWVVNIELKGVQGSGQNFEANDYLAQVANCVQQSGIAPDKVLFSSFALQNIIGMSHLLPNAQFGMLFAEKPEPRGIYADHTTDLRYNYLPFDVAHTNFVETTWAEQAHKQAILGFANPEVQTITKDMIAHVKAKNWGINAWGLFEQPSAERTKLYNQLIKNCKDVECPLTIITDYLDVWAL
jgi:glycerophosphoryl diester phosphodiesterase